MPQFSSEKTARHSAVPSAKNWDFGIRDWSDFSSVGIFRAALGHHSHILCARSNHFIPRILFHRMADPSDRSPQRKKCEGGALGKLQRLCERDKREIDCRLFAVQGLFTGSCNLTRYFHFMRFRMQFLE